MLRIYYLKQSDYQAYPEEYFFPHVSKDTWESTRQFLNKKVRQTKLLSETLTRQLINQTWGLSSKDYQLVKGEHGKPYLKVQNISAHFNISHSGDYIICAISDQNVGIDIELCGKPRLNVARHFFHPQEIALLNKTTDEKLQQKLFFNLWSVKESYLKYTGSGLSTPLSSFEVCFTGNNITLKKEHSLLPIMVQECPIDPNYSSFVCCQSIESFTIDTLKL